MKRLAVTLAGLVVLAIAVLWPAFQFELRRVRRSPTPPPSPAISRDFTVADDGDLTVTETLTRGLPRLGKHGIFRFFDRADPSAPHARRDPQTSR